MPATSHAFRLAAVASVILTIPVKGQSSLEALPLLNATRELRIGSATDPNVGFTSIVNMDVDRDGQIVLFEAGDRHVRVYSPAGQLVRTVGRRGTGPGEFTNAAEVGVRGDTIWAWLPRPACVIRILLFRRSGELLSSTDIPGVRVSMGNRAGIVQPRYMRPDAKLIGHQNCQTTPTPEERAAPAPVTPPRVPRIVFDLDGRPLDTLGWTIPSVITGTLAERPSITIEGRKHLLPEPLPDSRIAQHFADGLVFVDRPIATSGTSGTISVGRTSVAGDTVWKRTLTYRPLRYSDAALDSIARQSALLPGGMRVFQSGVERKESFANPDHAAAEIRGNMKFPPFQVAVSQHFVGADASVWLRRSDDGRPTTEWVVFDPNGRPRGRVALPNNARMMWSSGDVFWTSEADKDGVPFLVRYKLG